MSLYLQDEPISGQDGVLTLKSVKRSDSGQYKCKATDFDNLEADLSGTISLAVNCEWYTQIHSHKLQE